MIPLYEKIENDFNEVLEFVLSNSPYTESDLMKKDIVEYYKIVHRTHERVQKQIEQIEKNNAKT